MKTYIVKEIFGPTIQGEGSMAGTPMAFLRFSGCNMWDGRPETKAASACPYCDTDFLGGEKKTAEQICDELEVCLPSNRWVCVTGGEPLLQFDGDLAEAMHSRKMRMALETNGTIDIQIRHTGWFHHVACSPKVPFDEMNLRAFNDLKLLYPHPDPRMAPESFDGAVCGKLMLQPINGETELDAANTAATAEKLYTLTSRTTRGWTLSQQIHKLIGVR